MLEILDLNINFDISDGYDTSDIEYDYIEKLPNTNIKNTPKHQVKINRKINQLKSRFIYIFNKLYKFNNYNVSCDDVHNPN